MAWTNFLLIDLALFMVFYFLHLAAAKNQKVITNLFKEFKKTCSIKLTETVRWFIYFPIYIWFLINLPFLIVIGWPIFSISILYWHLYYFSDFLVFHFSSRDNHQFDKWFHKLDAGRTFLPVFLSKKIYDQNIIIDYETWELELVPWDGTIHKDWIGLSLREASSWIYFLYFLIELYLKYPHDIALNNLIKFLFKVYYWVGDDKRNKTTALQKLYIASCVLVTFLVRLITGLPIITLKVSFFLVGRLVLRSTIVNADRRKLRYLEDIFLEPNSCFRQNGWKSKLLLDQFRRNWMVYRIRNKN